MPKVIVLRGGPRDGERSEQQWIYPTVRIPEGRYILDRTTRDDAVVYYDWQEPLQHVEAEQEHSGQRHSSNG